MRLSAASSIPQAGGWLSHWRVVPANARSAFPSAIIIASSADLRFRSAAFHPESSLSFSNPRAPINGQECAIVTKPNRSYRNGRRRRHTAIIYAPAPRGTRPKSRGPCEAGPRHLLCKSFIHPPPSCVRCLGLEWPSFAGSSSRSMCRLLPNRHAQLIACEPNRPCKGRTNRFPHRILLPFDVGRKYGSATNSLPRSLARLRRFSSAAYADRTTAMANPEGQARHN